MGKVAFVFPGQGAQYPGMGLDLYESSQTARRLFDAAERIAPGTLDTCFRGDRESLTRTVNAQPCLFAVDYVCAALCAEAGVRPDALAGFSLGEVAAAAFSGMLTFEKAFSLILERARLMNACAEAHPGQMFAVLKLDADAVRSICAQIGRAWPVNYNCPGQTAVACARESAEALCERVKQAGGRAVRLAVSGAFHSPLMAPASEGLARALRGTAFGRAEIPVYANLTARPYEPGRETETLAAQVSSPVRWEETVRALCARGVTAFVETGPGDTLSGLIRRIDPSVKTYGASDAPSITALKGALPC